MKRIIELYLFVSIIIVATVLPGCKKEKVPVITTTSISDITSTTATSGGNILDEGSSLVTSRGVCWNTGSSPTIADSKTTDGMGADSFSSNLTGLKEITLYSVRAYASNSEGTGYGDEMTFTTSSSGTVADADGNIYNTITIGTQVWMRENLKTTRYSNGELIGTTTPATLNIINETNPKYQWAYDGNENDVNTYGRLYTWYAVNDNRKVCPTGWHLPYDGEWTTLTNYLISKGYGYAVGGSEIGKAMAATYGWEISSKAGTIGNDLAGNNSSGFTALPGGSRFFTGTFGSVGNSIHWWTAAEYSYTEAWGRLMWYKESGVGRNYFDKRIGFSVRCVKDL